MPILYGGEPSFFTRKPFATLRLPGLALDDRLIDSTPVGITVPRRGFTRKSRRARSRQT